MTDAPKPLTLGELVELLQGFVNENPSKRDTLVGLSKDPEGNGFAMLCGPADLLAEGKVEAWGPATEYDGKDVIVLWPGYPQFDLA